VVSGNSIPHSDHVSEESTAVQKPHLVLCPRFDLAPHIARLTVGNEMKSICPQITFQVAVPELRRISNRNSPTKSLHRRAGIQHDRRATEILIESKNRLAQRDPPLVIDLWRQVFQRGVRSPPDRTAPQDLLLLIEKLPLPNSV
jgi:hypothetical protein